jgi:hypothetical protein
MAAIDYAKNILSTPGKIVPGGKLIASYATLNDMMLVCIWDVPTLDALTLLVEQLNFLMTSTEIYPAVKADIFMSKFEMALKQAT